MKRFRNAALVVILGIASLAAKNAIQKRILKQDKTSLALKPLQASYHGQSLKRYSFGMDNFLADLIWIQLLQVASHAKITDGKVSWEYAQLEALTTLDHNFYQAYPFGAAYLTVFREDKLGAKLILEKWTKQMPSYWRAQYLLGFHLYNEMHDYEHAYKYMLRASAMEHAPYWLSSLGVRLLSETGATAQALSTSIELYTQLKEGSAKERLAKRIRSLHFQLELSTWKKALEAYRSEHQDEPSSLTALQTFRGEDERNLASLIHSENLPEEIESILTEKFPFAYDAKTRAVVSRQSTKDFEQTGIYKPKTH